MHRALALHAFSRLLPYWRLLLIPKVFARTFLAREEDKKFLTMAFKPHIGKARCGKEKRQHHVKQRQRPPGHLSPGVNCTVAMCALKFLIQNIASDSYVSR
jgi:hypothetical protein